jgi:hypothetical protein
MTREPEPWQTTHARPFLAIERSAVVVWALGEQQFRVVAGDESREVEHFAQTRELAHALAGA